jgi:hypothetical protein
MVTDSIQYKLASATSAHALNGALGTRNAAFAGDKPVANNPAIKTRLKNPEVLFFVFT